VVVDCAVAGSGHGADDTWRAVDGGGVGSSEDRSCGAVAEGTAHGPGQHARDLRRAQDLLQRDGLLDLGEGVQSGVAPRLDRRGGHLFDGRATLAHVEGRPPGVEVHEDAAARVLVSDEPVVHVGAVVSRQAVFDAGQGLRTVSCPHFLDAEDQDRAVRGERRHHAEVSAEEPPAQELSTLTTGTPARPALRSHDWPRMHP